MAEAVVTDVGKALAEYRLRVETEVDLGGRHRRSIKYVIDAAKRFGDGSGEGEGSGFGYGSGSGHG